jgi:hypothetical protein
MMCPTDEQQSQDSESHGAGVAKSIASGQLLTTLYGARHDTVREMQSGALEIPEIASAPEL